MHWRWLPVVGWGEQAFGLVRSACRCWLLSSLGGQTLRVLLLFYGTGLIGGGVGQVEKPGLQELAIADGALAISIR